MISDIIWTITLIKKIMNMDFWDVHISTRKFYNEPYIKFLKAKTNFILVKPNKTNTNSTI